MRQSRVRGLLRCFDGYLSIENLRLPSDYGYADLLFFLFGLFKLGQSVGIIDLSHQVFPKLAGSLFKVHVLERNLFVVVFVIKLNFGLEFGRGADFVLL